MNALAPRRLRLAIVIEHVNRRAGQERVIAELVSGLADRHDLDLYCFSATDVPHDQVRVRRLWCPSGSNTFQALWIPLVSALVIRPRRYDVILSQGGNCLVQNFVYAHTSHALRARTLRRNLDGETWSSARRLFERLRNCWAVAMERRALRRCPDRIIAMSHELARDLAHTYGLALEAFQVAPLGVDHEVFHPGLRDTLRGPLRAELGVSEGEVLLLFAGGLWVGKGLPLVIEALAQVEDPRVRLVVVGRGDEGAFGELARRLGVGHRVRFLGVTDQIQRYYAAADALVFPTRIEGFALVMAEAAACGLPLITTRTGDTEVLFPDGECGILVEPRVEEIAAAIRRLAADPELRARMGERAHQAARELTWERHNQLVEGFLLRQTAGEGPS